MDTPEVVRTLHAAGIKLMSVDDDEFDAEGPLTDPLRALIREHKTAILAEMREQRLGERDDFPSPVPRRYVVPPDCRARDACHRLGPCGPPATRASCLSIDLMAKEPPDGTPNSDRR